MNKEDARRRIEKLKEQIKKLNYAYFVLNKSDVSEAARDSLKRELKELETQFPELITPIRRLKEWEVFFPANLRKSAILPRRKVWKMFFGRRNFGVGKAH